MSSLPRHTTPVDTKQEEQDRLACEDLADVDAGRVIGHQVVQAWADSLIGCKWVHLDQQPGGYPGKE